ncbi:rhodanese-like domain-containing protein [Streptomyces sp. NPDC007264]|uniref:rhodanese-like domain-containing protein n=1 Tax=Streptomyces sp. NPDC007264 TaxID=3364777 RepID=UPI0036DB781C
MNVFHPGPGRVAIAEAVERTGPGTAAEAVLLDVREPHEWQAGHAPWAVHAALSQLTEGSPLPPQAQGRPLVVICRSGARSQKAAALLAARGAQAVDVIGGMRDWAQAGLPVVDERGKDGTVA